MLEFLSLRTSQSEMKIMDQLGSLHAFVRAAEARSFTRAGHQLGVSSSAVGKAVARLEARLGVRLLHRSTRTITLTPEGSQFLERCRRIFSEIEAAERELVHARSAPRGTLRVSLPLISVVLMPALTSFMRAYPEVQLDLDFSDRLVDVIQEGFDAVIRAGDIRDSRLMSRKLGTFRFRLVGAPAYFARRKPPRNPAELTSHACLHHRFATSGKLERWPLRRAARLELPVSAVVNTIEPLITMAEHGLGIACLPDIAVHEQLARGELISVLDAYIHHSGSYRVLWPSSRHVSPKLRAFVDHMSEHTFGAEPPVQTRRP